MIIMKKTIILILTLSFLAGCFTACSDDDFGDSIFDTTPPERNEFDMWLLDNFVYPYNIDIKYRMEDIESDFRYTLVPATYDQSKNMAKIIKYGWLETYDEVAGTNFTRKIAPKVLHFIGSKAYNNLGTYTAGTAEGGMKITIYDVNKLKTDPIDPNTINDAYFHTMHHEFAHILHQTKNYSTEFRKISDGKYNASQWYTVYNTASAARKDGFVSPYASSYPDEDFVEVLSIYITYTPQRWESLMQDAGTTGGPIIQQKLDIVTTYLKNSWGIDINTLRDVSIRRLNELVYIDFENL